MTDQTPNDTSDSQSQYHSNLRNLIDISSNIKNASQRKPSMHTKIASNERKRGVTPTLARKEFKSSVYELQIEEAQEWIELIFEEYSFDSIEDFQNKLKDGVILCNLLCKLDPKVHIKYSQTPKQAASCLDNIQVFLNICQDWKLNSTFTGVDLYELQNFSKVITCIHELGERFTKLGFSPAFESKSKIFLTGNSEFNETSKSAWGSNITNNSVERATVWSSSHRIKFDRSKTDKNTTETSEPIQKSSTRGDKEDQTQKQQGVNSNYDASIIPDESNKNSKTLPEHREEDDSSESETDDEYDEEGFNSESTSGEEPAIPTVELEKTNNINEQTESRDLEKREYEVPNTQQAERKEKEPECLKFETKSDADSTSIDPNSTSSPFDLELTENEIESKLVKGEKYNNLLKKYTILQQQITEYQNNLRDFEIIGKSESSPAQSSSSKSTRKGKLMKNKRDKNKDQTSTPTLLSTGSSNKLPLSARSQSSEEKLRFANLTEKVKLQRMRIIQEIIDRETEYNECLGYLFDSRKCLDNEAVIPFSESKSLFLNIEDIYNFHKELLAYLNDKVNSISSHDCWSISVGEYLLKLSQQSSMYSLYGSCNQFELIQLIETLSQQLKTFTSCLLHNICYFSSKDSLPFDLYCLLIKPIQHICNYPAVIMELLSATEENHPDKLLLNQSIDNMFSFSNLLNEKKKICENHLKLLDLRCALVDIPKGFNLIEANRYFIKEATLTKISNGRSQERVFFLFSDILIYCSRSVLKQGKLQFKGKISLQSFTVNNLPDSDTYKHAFELLRVDHKKKKYIISFKDEKEKQSWLLETQTLGYERPMQAYQRLYPQSFYEKFIGQDIRPDGRNLQSIRPLHIGIGSISSTFGSSMVKLGNTSVVAGVQAEMGELEQGVSQITINVEMSSSGANFGKPSRNIQVVGSQLRKLVEECNLVTNLEELFIEHQEKKLFWHLLVDIYCIDDSGGLFNSCLLALVCALKNTTLPNCKIENDKLFSSLDRPIQLSIIPEFPIAVTFIIYDGHIIADPTNEEENLSEATIIVVGSNKSNKLWSVIKFGKPVPLAKLANCLLLGEQIIPEISKLLP